MGSADAETFKRVGEIRECGVSESVVIRWSQCYWAADLGRGFVTEFRLLGACDEGEGRRKGGKFCFM